MSSNPKISIIVPCYNYARFLPDCLNSILAQEGGFDLEVIAIDDASTDNTLEVLAAYADPRLRVVRNEGNLGHVGTIHKGLMLAKGDLIARIDPDDRYRANFLNIVVAKFERHPEVGLVYGDAAVMDEYGAIQTERSDRVHDGRDFKGNEFIRLLEDNCICAPTAMARREMWMSALPVPKDLAFNDWYFNIMIGRRSEFYYVNTVLADYRVHSSNHHVKIVRDKSEEPSIFALLDRVFREKEISPELEQLKQQSRGRVYSAHYLTLADKYFGLGMNDDARRCYWNAIRNRPSKMLNPGIQRRLSATLFGRERYESAKTRLLTLTHRRS